MNEVKRIPIVYTVTIEDGLTYLDTVSDCVLDFLYIACDLFEGTNYEEWTLTHLLEDHSDRCDVIAKGVAKKHSIKPREIYEEIQMIDIGFLGTIMQAFAFCREWNIVSDVPRMLVRSAMIALRGKLNGNKYHVTIGKDINKKN